MIVDALPGKVTIVAETAGTDSLLLVTAEDESTIRSVLNLIELVGGAEGEDVAFPRSAIYPVQLFGKTNYRARLSRTQVSRWLDAELHNYLDYPSIVRMRREQP